MASALKNLSSYDENHLPSAAEMHFGIVVADWNAHITHALYEGCQTTLLRHGASETNIHIAQVPGAFELPIAARLLIGSKKLDAVIAIGCVIQGDTRHNEYINQAVASGLVQLSLASGIPCIFGVLTPNNEAQALERAGGALGNKGVEAAVAAIRMAAIKKSMAEPSTRIGF